MAGPRSKSPTESPRRTLMCPTATPAGWVTSTTLSRLRPQLFSACPNASLSRSRVAIPRGVTGLTDPPPVRRFMWCLLKPWMPASRLANARESAGGPCENARPRSSASLCAPPNLRHNSLSIYRKNPYYPYFMGLSIHKLNLDSSFCGHKIAPGVGIEAGGNRDAASDLVAEIVLTTLPVDRPPVERSQWSLRWSRIEKTEEIEPWQP